MRLSPLKLRIFVGVVFAAASVTYWWMFAVWQSRAERKFVLTEVSRWLVRGEHAIPIPPNVVRDDQGQPLYSWRLQVVRDCLPSPDIHISGAQWQEYIKTNYVERGKLWMTTGRSSGPLVMGIIGNGTIFEPGKTTFPVDVSPDTILFVEVTRDDVHWMQPGDIELAELERPNRRVPDYFRSDVIAGFHVAFADGSLWRLSEEVPSDLIAEFAKSKKLRRVDRETAFVPYRLE